MAKNNKGTICVQGGWQPKTGEPRVLPIYQSTTFKYDTSEQMGKLFDLEEYQKHKILRLSIHASFNHSSKRSPR